MADAAHSVTATFMMRAHTMFSIMSILRFVVEQSRASLSRVRLCGPWGQFVGAGLAARHGISFPSARLARGGRQHSLKKQHNCHLSCQVCVHGARAARWARAPDRARAACAYWPRPRAYLRQRRHYNVPSAMCARAALQLIIHNHWGGLATVLTPMRFNCLRAGILP